MQPQGQMHVHFIVQLALSPLSAYLCSYHKHHDRDREPQPILGYFLRHVNRALAERPPQAGQQPDPGQRADRVQDEERHPAHAGPAGRRR